MWRLFQHDPLLSAEDRLFQIECYRWLLCNFGSDHFYDNTELVLPTDEYFPAILRSETEMAESLFEYVRTHAGMTSWPCRLIRVDEIERNVGDTLIVQGVEDEPLGTFEVDEGNSVTISYRKDQLSDPMQLVATFAHELAHYLIGTADQLPPGGWENVEFATDVAAVFMGFGVFMCNSAFRYSQYSDGNIQGWSSSRSGYLSEAEFSYSLAMFLELKRIESSIVLDHLKPNVRAYLKRARKELKEDPELEELRPTDGT